MKIGKTAGGLVRLLGVGAIAFGMSGEARGETLGTLKIYNCSGIQEPETRFQHRNDSGILEAPTDPYDDSSSKEFQLNNLPNNSFEIYILNNDSRMYRDARPENINSPFDIKLVYKGTISEGTSLDNWFRFELGTTSFGSKPLTLQTPLGSRYDIRDIISNHSGIFNLPDLAAGSYNTGTPYASYQVDFQPINIPEPSSLALAGTSALAVGAWGVYDLMRRRKEEEKEGKDIHHYHHA